MLGLNHLYSGKKQSIDDSLSSLCADLKKNYNISPEAYQNFDVKRGLRNSNGSGVIAGLTKVCSVEGYLLTSDGVQVPKPGELFYRGYEICDLAENCKKENRFGFEEICYLLLFGELPKKNQLYNFSKILSSARELPDDFVEDMIMKAPSPNIMNKLARGVLSLYSYDDDPDSLELENVLKQSVSLIAQLPIIMAYSYQVKRWNYDKRSMYIHHILSEHCTSEVILNSIRSDKKFTPQEARLLDLCLILHAEHGGGNNSTFATRVLTSSDTDTYSAIAAGIGSLKGPKHGGANLKVAEMVSDMLANIKDVTNEGEVADYIGKIVRKEAGDRTGLVYGMGHAVYTESDPRAIILKNELETFVKGTAFEQEFLLLKLVESLTPEVFAKEKGSGKIISANVDMFSGLVYKTLRIPQELYTPLFTVARMAGWCAHRIEELLTGGRIIRPAYKSMSQKMEYIPLSERK